MISKAKRHISRAITRCQLTVESWPFQKFCRYKGTGNFRENMKNENVSIHVQTMDPTIFSVIPSTIYHPSTVLSMEATSVTPPVSARVWPSTCLHKTLTAFSQTFLLYVTNGPVTPLPGFIMKFNDPEDLLMLCPPSIMPLLSTKYTPPTFCYLDQAEVSLML